jgi:hypothetical protein
MVLVNSRKSDIFTCNVNFSYPYQSDSYTNVKQPEGKVNFILDSYLPSRLKTINSIQIFHFSATALITPLW